MGLPRTRQAIPLSGKEEGLCDGKGSVLGTGMEVRDSECT